MAISEQNRKNYGRDERETIESKLMRLEEDIRKLKVEFDIFFNKGSKRPPYDTKNRVEVLVKRIGDERRLTYAQRYQYNTLVSRYTAFKELWRRTMQAREEGRNNIAAIRETVQHTHNAQDNQVVFVCKDVRNEEETIKTVFDTLVQAKEKCGEPTNDMNFQNFHQFLAGKADTIKNQLKCNSIQFSVSIVEGKVAFKAKAG